MIVGPLAIGFAAWLLALPALGQSEDTAEFREFGVEMGLPVPDHDATEVRIWIEHSLYAPQFLYRFRERFGAVEGQRYVWSRAKERDVTGEFYKESYCKGEPLRSTRKLVWCLTPAGTPEEWARVFRALPIDELRNVPPQSTLKRDYGVMDGHSVVIELTRPGVDVSVHYTSPQSCARSERACRVVDTFERLVGSLH